MTQQLSDAFDAADEALDEELDNLIGQFAPANAKFVSDYQNARIIIDAAASHASPNQPTPAPTPTTPAIAKPKKTNPENDKRPSATEAVF